MMFSIFRNRPVGRQGSSSVHAQPSRPRPTLETLEGRTLLSTGTEAVSPGITGLAFPTATIAAAAVAQPSILATSPANGDTGVRRDIFIGADLTLPNGPLSISTVNGSNVTLRKVSDNSLVSAIVNTSGGGDSIVLQPNAPLASNTQYVFAVTSGVKDVSGQSLVPYAMKFTTGTAGGTTDTGAFKFTTTKLSNAAGQFFTCVAVGPDHKLYASTLDGKIIRWSINSDGTLGTSQTINSIRDANGGNRVVIGFAFDPSSTSTNIKLWVSNAEYKFDTTTNPWGSKITLLTGSSLTTVKDVVVGLARSTYNHSLNQPSFGPDGALYICVPGTTSQGAKDNVWGFRNEELMSAAILRVDVSKITPGSPVNVQTNGGPNYNPKATGAPVTLYATGFRNAYDMVWTQDGRLYTADNGSNAGGAVPGTPSGVSPAVKGVSPVNEGQSDHLYRVVKGGYYGHPDPKRGEYVLDGGNPTSSTDSGEVKSYPVSTKPETNWRGIAFDFGAKNSVNGIMEYHGSAFNGALDGALLATRYSGGKDVVILTRNSDGTIKQYITGAPGLTGFNNPLDLAEDPNTGYIYVAEHDGQQINLVKPVAVPAASTDGSFTSRDISATATGSTTQPSGSTNAYDVTAGGNNISSTADGFRFVYRQQTGDFDIKSQVTSFTGPDVTGKAGLMARETLTAGSRNVFAQTTVADTFRLSYRSATSGTTTRVSSGTSSYPNAWVRLRRVGNVFTAYRSTDGSTWTKIGEVTMTMPSTLYFGLAVTAANSTGATATAKFRNVTNTGSTTPVAQATWSTGTALPVAMAELRGAVISGKIYIAGEGSPHTYKFDPSTKLWTDVGADRTYLGDPTDAEHGTETVNGKMYLFGGLNDSSRNKVQIYDPATNKWTLGLNQPFNAGSSNSAAINGEIYIAGGAIKDSTGYHPVAKAAKYNPATNSWTNLPDMPAPRHAAASGTDGTKLYVFGGRDQGLEASSGTNTVSIYDPATNKWITSNDAGGPKPVPRNLRGQVKAAFYNGEFYIFGGETSYSTDPGATADLVFHEVDIYNPTTNTWRRGPDMPTARHAVLPIRLNNQIYVIGGGVHSKTSTSPIVEILTIP